MVERLRRIIEPFESDESIMFAAIYTIDGTPLVTHIKDRKYIPVVEWMERQIDVVSRQIMEDRLDSVEFRLGGEGILFRPLSGGLILVVGTSDETSLYKLRVDTETLRRMV
ncbi:hypothetical protein [Archaeoglobus neptunius]|uniref:hypothetical protein n=1 Tax=Archaeoglobus neptunius TaxID=2798580 RepID=UPI0019279636|nr:hypothetical protein [Archaeoglobus neptunius]